MINVNVLVGRGVGFTETIYLKGISKVGYVPDISTPDISSWDGQFEKRPFTVIVCGAETIDIVTELVTSYYLFHN